MARSDRRPPSGPRLLHIEDVQSNADVVAAVLRARPDSTLETVPTGAEGLALAARRRFDLILLDMHLPDMSGADVLAGLRARARTRETPVVVLTADVSASPPGASAVLTKPFKVEHLLETIDAFTG